MVTIMGNEKPICYRLPSEYKERAITVIGVVNMGKGCSHQK